MNCVGTLEGHTKSVLSVAFNTSGMLASGSWGGTIKLWNINTNECVVTLGGHLSSVNSVAFNTDGKILASGGGDNTIKLWDISTMNCVGTLKGHRLDVTSVAFNGDEMLASGSYDNTIGLTRFYTKKFVNTALMTMNRCGLIDDVIDNIMDKLGVIDNKGKITGCVV
jgi:WD40 repeat protein